MRFSEAFEKWQKEGGYLVIENQGFFHAPNTLGTIIELVRRYVKIGSNWIQVYDGNNIFECPYYLMLKDAWEVRKELA